MSSRAELTCCSSRARRSTTAAAISSSCVSEALPYGSLASSRKWSVSRLESMLEWMATFNADRLRSSSRLMLRIRRLLEGPIAPRPCELHERHRPCQRLDDGGDGRKDANSSQLGGNSPRGS